MPLRLAKVRALLDSPRGRRGLRIGSLSLFGLSFASLLLAIAGMRLVGERHWLTTALLYAPRMVFALPLPLATLALALFGPRRLLWAMPLALWLVLFPIMGLQLGLQSTLGRLRAAAQAAGDRPRPHLRLLSYNAASGQSPVDLAAVVNAARPDILLIQEWNQVLEPPLEPAIPGYHRHRLGQFWVASRYPIDEIYVPPLITQPGGQRRSSRFVRYRLLTPLGPVHVLNVHPASPREDLSGITGLDTSSQLRLRQAENIASEAGRSPEPVIIAGDTNLPGGSWILQHTLGRYRDGFEAVGRGFGYTFPAHRPWMRIDRILADHRLHFVRFEVLGNPQASDHLAVLAELASSSP